MPGRKKWKYISKNFQKGVVEYNPESKEVEVTTKIPLEDVDIPELSFEEQKELVDSPSRVMHKPDCCQVGGKTNNIDPNCDCACHGI